jgi:two-component system phosphate regulon response regulator PhoB
VSRRTIVVADDEPDMLQLVQSTLASGGFDVVTAFDGETALDRVRETAPALAVLDLMMPTMTGIDVCRAMKADPNTSGIPIIILTARGGEVDRVVAFELGADDYVTKPFSPRELILRVKAILRSLDASRSRSGPVRIGEIYLDYDRHVVTVGSRIVDLTATEFKLLSVLMESQGRVQSRESILLEVWGSDSEIEPRTVDTQVRRLREKLGIAGEQLQTVRGFGYRLDSR